MRKIFFTYYTGFCGSGGHAVDEFEDDVTNKELDQYAYDGAIANAEMYGIYPTEDASDDYDEEESRGDEYSDGIEGTWCDYIAEKHEGYVT